VQFEARILASTSQAQKLSISCISCDSTQQDDRIILHTLVTQLEPRATLQRTQSLLSTQLWQRWCRPVREHECCLAM